MRIALPDGTRIFFEVIGRKLVPDGPTMRERPTLLVLPVEGEPVLVVPELERPRAESAAASDVVRIVSWAETEDPYEHERPDVRRHHASRVAEPGHQAEHEAAGDVDDESAPGEEGRRHAVHEIGEEETRGRAERAAGCDEQVGHGGSIAQSRGP